MIAIYEDQIGEYNPDDYEPVSVFEDGEWLRDDGGYAEFYPEESTTEDVLAQQLDGPSAVAVIVEDAEGLLKEWDQHPTTEDMDAPTERDNDSEGEGDEPDSLVETDFDVDQPWEKGETDRTNRSFSFVEGSDSGRTPIDRVEEAPDDAIIHAEVDEDGDVEGLYYE